MRNAERGMRNGPRRRRPPRPEPKIGPYPSIPHSALRTPHSAFRSFRIPHSAFGSFISQRFYRIEPRRPRRRRDAEHEPEENRDGACERGAPHGHRELEVQREAQQLPGAEAEQDAEESAHERER